MCVVLCTWSCACGFSRCSLSKTKRARLLMPRALCTPCSQKQTCVSQTTDGVYSRTTRTKVDHTSRGHARVSPQHHGAHTRAASPHYSGPSAEKQPALRVASRVQSTVRRHMRRSCAHASPLSKVSLIVVCPLAAWPTPRAPCVLAAIICTHLESHRSHLVSPALAYYWRVCSYFFSPEASSFLTSS